MTPPASKGKRVLVVAHSVILQANRPIYLEMVKAGHEVQMIVSDQVDFEPSEIDGLTLRQLTRIDAVDSTRFYRYAGLDQAFSEFQPDLVLLDLEPDSKLAVQIAGLCRMDRRQPIPFHVQTCENLGIWESTKGTFPARVAKLLLRRRYLATARRGITHVFPISNDGQHLLESFGFQNRVTRIPLGVDTQRFRPDPDLRATTRKSLALPEDVPVVAYFGRISKAKGVHLLLQTLLNIPDLPWVLLLDEFDSNDDDYLNQIDRLLTEDLFRDRLFRFEAAHLEMPRFMNAADLVVMPSQRTDGWLEQYGRVAAEMLACGRRVLSSDSGALPDVGGEASLRFPEKDEQMLEKMLRTELTRPADEVIAFEQTSREWALAELSVARQWALMRPILGL